MKLVDLRDYVQTQVKSSSMKDDFLAELTDYLDSDLIEVEVTEEHISTGEMHNPSCCPFALAILQSTAALDISKIIVSEYLVMTSCDQERTAKATRAANHFMEFFDQGPESHPRLFVCPGRLVIANQFFWFVREYEKSPFDSVIDFINQVYEPCQARKRKGLLRANANA